MCGKDTCIICLGRIYEDGTAILHNNLPLLRNPSEMIETAPKIPCFHRKCYERLIESNMTRCPCGCGSMLAELTMVVFVCNRLQRAIDEVSMVILGRDEIHEIPDIKLRMKVVEFLIDSLINFMSSSQKLTLSSVLTKMSHYSIVPKDRYLQKLQEGTFDNSYESIIQLLDLYSKTKPPYINTIIIEVAADSISTLNDQNRKVSVATRIISMIDDMGPFDDEDDAEDSLKMTKAKMQRV